MLTAIENDRLYWQCLRYDEDGELVSCGTALSAHIEEAVYHSNEGAVIALPRCECGTQCFLKADYTVKELWRATQSVANEEGEIWAYVLPLRYVRNLRAQWMLYVRGKAEHAPVVELPPHDALIVDPDMTHALWFGFQAVREYLRSIGAAHLLNQLPTAPLKELE